MIRSTTIIALTLLVGFGSPAKSQALDLSRVDALFSEEARIEINVTGPLLAMVAEMSRGDDPAFAAMLGQLRGVYVRQYDLSSGRGDIHARVRDLARSLERGGWQVLARVRSDAENVHIYVRPEGSLLNGLVVMVLDQDEGEATFVSIDGRVDPAQIGRLGKQFNVPALEHATASGR